MHVFSLGSNPETFILFKTVLNLISPLFVTNKTMLVNKTIWIKSSLIIIIMLAGQDPPSPPPPLPHGILVLEISSATAESGWGLALLSLCYH
jgi:hypothetical protein